MPQEHSTNIHTRTKFNRPRVPYDLVPRLQLIERLNHHFDRPLTLVVAPAGYGKTYLVSSWLENRNEPIAYLSLDEEDDDLDVFLSYFLAAIRAVLPGAVTKTVTLLRSATQVPLQAVVDSLVNELNKINQPFFLVLDDYYTISRPEVRDFLAELLRYPPTSLRLVLISRNDPLLPLDRYRALNQITEIRQNDLRFSLTETTAFLAQATGAQLDEATASRLQMSTEGWATGLRLAALSIHRGGDIDDLLTELQGTNRFAEEYLLSEVLTNLPNDIQEFLIKISVLDRFCVGLCGSVVVLGESEYTEQTIFETIVEANLFLIPLDADREWYRFHHLIQQLLKKQLRQRYSPEEIALLHARAADWFAREGFFEEAMHYTLASGDIFRAVHLAEATWRNEVNLNLRDYQLIFFLNIVSRWANYFIEEDPRLQFKKAILEAENQMIEAYAISWVEGHDPDKPFLVGYSYKILVKLQRHLFEVLGESMPVDSTSSTASLFNIIIHARDMAVESGTIRSYMLDNNNNQNPIEYLVTPLESGEKEIRIEILYDNHWLAGIRRNILVNRAP